MLRELCAECVTMVIKAISEDDKDDSCDATSHDSGNNLPHTILHHCGNWLGDECAQLLCVIVMCALLNVTWRVTEPIWIVGTLCHQAHRCFGTICTESLG